MSTLASLNIEVRPEQPGDADALRALHIDAFTASRYGYGGEAEIVDALRAGCPDLISLVALIDGHPVGHIVFSPAVIEGPNGSMTGMGLAPMAVSPARQGLGIGARLIADGLAALRARGCPFVIVLGDRGYYDRFGFAPAASRGVSCAIEGVPAEAFMIQVLDSRAAIGPGIARYRPELS